MNNKRECRKCGEKIPNWYKIDGKNKNLSNRKFCLKCSPYRGHNTKSIDPSSPLKKKKPYSQWSEKAKQKGKENIYKRGWKRKKNLVELYGGSCKKCGYYKKRLLYCYKIKTAYHWDL